MIKLRSLTLSLMLFMVVSGCSAGNGNVPASATAETPSETPLPEKATAPVDTATPESDPRRAVGLPLAMIQLGEIVAIGESGFSLSFDEIITDSRCPEDATCVWAGQVKVMLSLWQDEAFVESFTLTGGELLDGDYNQFDFESFQITLTDVLPHPRLEDKTEQTPEVVLQIEVAE